MGFCVNSPEVVLETINIAVPDICLMAIQYSLLSHEYALNVTFPILQEKKVEVVMGSSLNCGYLVGNETWNYSFDKIPREMAIKRMAIEKVCKSHGVDMRTAALQFSMAHPVVFAVLTGCRNAGQITQNYYSLEKKNRTPQTFWEELKVQT